MNQKLFSAVVVRKGEVLSKVIGKMLRVIKIRLRKATNFKKLFPFRRQIFNSSS